MQPFQMNETCEKCINHINFLKFLEINFFFKWWKVCIFDDCSRYIYKSIFLVKISITVLEVWHFLINLTIIINIFKRGLCAQTTVLYIIIYMIHNFFLIGEDPVELRNVDYLNFWGNQAPIISHIRNWCTIF